MIYLTFNPVWIGDKPRKINSKFYIQFLFFKSLKMYNIQLFHPGKRAVHRHY